VPARLLLGPSRSRTHAVTCHLCLHSQATCNKERSLQPIEIIEFACVVLETTSARSLGEFQSYVGGRCPGKLVASCCGAGEELRAGTPSTSRGGP
jgi:hypothetical protein